MNRILWKSIQKLNFLSLNSKTIVVLTVRDTYIRCLYYSIIPPYLIKNPLIHWHFRRLTLNHKPGRGKSIVNHNIGSPGHSLKKKSLFNRYKPHRHIQLRCQIVDKVLPDPLLAC